jgi:hypothetical protein
MWPEFPHLVVVTQAEDFTLPSINVWGEKELEAAFMRLSELIPDCVEE